MNPESPLYPSLRPTSWKRLLFASLALFLTGLLFALLPLADAINRKVSPLRLPVKPAVAAPLHVSRKKLEVTESRPSPKATNVAQPRAPTQQAQRPRPVLKLSRQLPNLSQRLPLGTLLPGLGDTAFNFATGPTVAEGLSAPATPLTSFTVRDLDAPPRLLNTLRPLYPLLAKQRGLEGYVDIEFVITKDGSIGTVTVLQADPTEVFDDAACKTAKNWRFSVPKRAGIAVEVLARQRIQFRLEK